MATGYPAEDYTVLFCCYRNRADDAAQIAGWICLVFSVVTLNPINFVAAVCVIYAKERQKPGLYLPLLVMHVSTFQSVPNSTLLLEG